MTHDSSSCSATRRVAACAVVYFLAVLAHLAQWAAGRKVDRDRGGRREPVAVGGASRRHPSERRAPVGRRSEPERMALFGRIGVALTVVAAFVHFIAVVSPRSRRRPGAGALGQHVRVHADRHARSWSSATCCSTTAIGLSWLSPVVTSFVLVTLMVDVLLLYTPVVPLRDALQSPWLVIHVVAAIIATGAFTLGGMCSALFLVKERWEEQARRRAGGGGYLARLPALGVLDRIAYRTHAFAFPIWTFAALIAGPIWAHYAWGRYWGWDPKEVWAFITWVVYAAYLHARATRAGRAARPRSSRSSAWRRCGSTSSGSTSSSAAAASTRTPLPSRPRSVRTL